MRKNSPNYLSTIEVLRKIEHFKGMKDSELDEILEKCTSKGCDTIVTII